MSDTSDTTRREHAGRRVEKEILLPGTPEAIYEAWANPEGIAQWFVDRAEGEMRAGDTIQWVFEEFGLQLPIEVYRAEPGRRLAFGGEPPGRPPALQEILLESEGGKTRLRLVNSGFGEGAQWDEEYEGTESGWEMALATLHRWLELGSPRGRTHVLVMRPAELDYGTLQPLYRTAAGLGGWLASEARLSSEPLAAGDALELDLRDGGTLTGRVLASSRTEILLSWDELDGVLGLKCFSRGPAGRAVAMDLNVWPAVEEARESELRALLNSSLDRLVPLVPGP